MTPLHLPTPSCAPSGWNTDSDHARALLDQLEAIYDIALSNNDGTLPPPERADRFHDLRASLERMELLLYHPSPCSDDLYSCHYFDQFLESWVQYVFSVRFWDAEGNCLPGWGCMDDLGGCRYRIIALNSQAPWVCLEGVAPAAGADDFICPSIVSYGAAFLAGPEEDRKPVELRSVYTPHQENAFSYLLAVLDITT